jgi:4-amino-4-deoxy-L-arabinose transferase-like glycosyltransferase
MNSKFGKGFWLIAIISCMIVFYNLGGIPLLDPDEPVYAQTPKEMLLFHDFTSPRIYGHFWYDKPPMYYWLVAGAFKIFGVNEFAARVPSAVLAVLCVLTVYWYARKMFSERAAILSSLILITSIEYFYLAKAAVTDITLTCFLTLCLLAFMRRSYYSAYVFAGLAVLTKGPVGLLFPGTIILLYFLATNNLKKLLQIKMISGLLLFSAVAVPWYWIMYHLHGNAFLDTFIGFNNITRFTSPEHPEGVLWYYYIPVLILGFFPWTAILAQSVWASLTRSNRDFYPLLFLNIWAAFIFIFFTISRTKLVSYILPMYPPLAMIAGWYLDSLWNEYRNPSRNYGWLALQLLLAVGFAGGMFWGLHSMPVLKSGVYVCTAIFAAMALMTAVFLFNRQVGKAFGATVAGMLLFSFALTGMLFPAAASNFSSKELAARFTACYDGVSPVYVTKFLHPGFTFYSGQYGREINDKQPLAKTLANKKKAYYVLRKAEAQKLIEEKVPVKIVWAHADRVLLLKE